MPTHSETKEKIIRFLRMRGASLPVHIAKEISQSILFTSAFLSELLSEKKIKISHMRVGSSPVYFIPGQEFQLERYLDSIKGKEKEALVLLKDKKIIEDSKQDTAIRVAIRSIKDFAIPFQKNNRLYWRYFTIPESEFQDEKIEEKTEKPLPKPESEKKEDLQKKPEINIFDKKEEPKPKKKIIRKIIKKKPAPKTNEKFFNKVKEFLNEKSIEISGIESIGKNELVFRVSKKGEEKLLFAYNKKQLKEEDIIKANKKASEENLKYILLSLGEPLKRVSNLIEAIKNLSEIEKLE